MNTRPIPWHAGFVFALLVAGPAVAQTPIGATIPCGPIHCAGEPAGPQGRPALRPRWTPPKPDRIALAPRNVAGLFLVKFVEGSHVRLGTNGFRVDRRLHDMAPHQSGRLARAGLGGPPAAARLDIELAALSEMAGRYEASHGFRPAYAFRPNQPRDGVDAQFAEREELEMRSGEELADLDLYYVFHAPNFSDRAAQERFMNELNGFRLVEQVTPLVLADVPQRRSPPTPARSKAIWVRRRAGSTLCRHGRGAAAGAKGSCSPTSNMIGWRIMRIFPPHPPAFPAGWFIAASTPHSRNTERP